MRARNMDRIVNSQDSTITLLEIQAQKTNAEFEAKLKDANDKLEAKTEVAKLMGGAVDSFREQLDDSQKADRKHRRQNKLLAGLLVGVVILVVGK